MRCVMPVIAALLIHCASSYSPQMPKRLPSLSSNLSSPNLSSISALHRVLIHSDRTVQRFFSSYYNKPTHISIKSNKPRTDAPHIFDREVDLMVDSVVYCSASSVVELKTGKAKEIYPLCGLAQLFEATQGGEEPTVFELLEWKVDEGRLSRKYRLENHHVDCQIEERFVEGCFELF